MNNKLFWTIADGPGYIGCFVDSATRVLPDKKDSASGSQITSSSCRTACTGYRFFGLEVAYECWCGNGNYQM